MARAPRVSLAMSCNSYGRYLRTAVDSILAQRGCDVEVVVIDDASTDETADVLRSYAGDGRVRAIRHDVRRGHLPSNNEGLALGRGEFVGVFDADDFLTSPYALARKVDVFDAHPRVGLVYSAYVLVDEADQPFRLFRPWPSDYVRSGLDEFAHLINACYVPHTSTLVRRSLHTRPDEVYDLSSPRAATDDLLRTIDKAFAALDSEGARRLAHLRGGAVTRALLHQTRTDRSLGRVRRSWAGLLDAARRAPRLLLSGAFHWALVRLLLLTAVGNANYLRLVSTRDRVRGGKGAVA
jgi:glycosyltransferase involved in cell wall biosynthesis